MRGKIEQEQKRMGSRMKKKKSQGSVFSLVQNLAWCACLKPEVDLFDPKQRGSIVSCCKQCFRQFPGNLPLQQSKNSINGFKLPFSENFLGVSGLIHTLKSNLFQNHTVRKLLNFTQ